MQITRFLQCVSVINGAVAFAALGGYPPFSYGVYGMLMLIGALLVWQSRGTLRLILFAIWLLLIALLNASHGDVMMFSGVLLTLTVLFCICGMIPASDRRLCIGNWFAPAYVIHLLCVGFYAWVL